ncbi:MAG: hypothetical protein O2819_03955 [Planctomycetota bacterium]|nr:hypothetical protein [Planctomycetota bacterium]MDA1106618.1 hypothetical protein [Planctomycetota bacterium]
MRDSHPCHDSNRREGTDSSTHWTPRPRRGSIATLPDSVLAVIQSIESNPDTDCSFRVEMDATVRGLPGTKLEQPITLALNELIQEMRGFWDSSTPRSDRAIVVCARTDHGTVHVHVMGDAPGHDEEESFEPPPETEGLARCRSLVAELGGRCSVRLVPFGRGVMVSMLIPEGHLMGASDSDDTDERDG